MYLGKSNEINNERIKAQVNRGFKISFCHQKSNRKSRQTVHEIFFNLQYNCAEVPISPISKLIPPFSADLSFLKIILTFRSVSTKW